LEARKTKADEAITPLRSNRSVKHGDALVIDYDAFAGEARRIYVRYAVEVVEAFTFCPWARSAREAGRVQCNVVFGEAPTVDDLLVELQTASAHSDIDVTLLVMPETTLDRMGLRRLTSTLHARYEAASGRGNTALAIADFHPTAPLDMASPERLVPFIRKSPDPTLQLIRHDALDAARRGALDGTRAATLEMMLQGGLKEGPVHARIANANHRTVQRETPRSILQALEAIARDRSASYSQLGAPPTPWDAWWKIQDLVS